MQSAGLLELEDVGSICNHCGKEDLNPEQAQFCHNCLQVAFCSVECAKKSWEEHKNYCTTLTPEVANELIGPRMGGRGGRGGGGGARPSGFRPRMRPAGGWRSYRPGAVRPSGATRW